MSFYIAKFFWLILNPFNILIILNTFCVLCFFFNLKKIKTLSMLMLVFFFILSCVLPTGKFLLYLLEKNYHKFSEISNLENIDGILILGGSTNPILSSQYNQIIFKDSAERLFESQRIIKKFPNAKVIYSGGSGKIFNNNYKETDDARNFFNINNININQIIFEDTSRNTYENILYSHKLAKALSSEKWLLITSAFHLKRSTYVAKKIGWNLKPYPTDFKVSKKFNFNFSINFFSNLSSFHLASHEWIGIYYYYFTNKLDL